jgi:hypothetical protein
MLIFFFANELRGKETRGKHPNSKRVALLQYRAMSLAASVIDPSLERNELHLLALEELEQLDVPEALFARGIKYWHGIGVRKCDDDEARRLIYRSAELGHCVARAWCFRFGIGVPVDHERSVALFQASSARGHPIGTHMHATILHIAPKFTIQLKISSAGTVVIERIHSETSTKLSSSSDVPLCSDTRQRSARLAYRSFLMLSLPKRSQRCA